MTMIKTSREEIATYGFKDKESLLKSLKKSLRLHEKIVNDEDDDDIEYLRDCINYLNNLFKRYVETTSTVIKTLNIMGLKQLSFWLKTMMITIFI